MGERAPRDPNEEEPDARLYTSEPLEAEDGSEYVIRQQNVGRGSEIGGGEWPDPDTPARAPAPGAAADEPDPEVDQSMRASPSGLRRPRARDS